MPAVAAVRFEWAEHLGHSRQSCCLAAWPVAVGVGRTQRVHWTGSPGYTVAAEALAAVVVVVLFVVVVVVVVVLLVAGVTVEAMPGTVRWYLIGRTDVLQMLEE